MTSEQESIRRLFKALCRRPRESFPAARKRLNAPTTQGVYVICDKDGVVLHVGRTMGGQGGLRQRLKDHLAGISSFAQEYLKGDGAKLRSGCTYQCIEEPDRRTRALLEAYGVGVLCPRHIGLGR